MIKKKGRPKKEDNKVFGYRLRLTKDEYERLDNLSKKTGETKIDLLLEGFKMVENTHGYNGVRVGDCVRMNYSRAGITDIKAKVTKQTIECDTAGKVTETAVFTKQLWEG